MFHELPPTAGLPPRFRDLLAFSGSDDLEGALAGFLGVSELQLESSASACLVVALEYLKTRTSRRTVVIPGYTCPLVVIAAKQAGCQVIACDTVAGTLDLDLDHLGELIGPDTLCVIATHYGGALTDVARVKNFVRTASPEIAVIEDAAQAFGARWGSEAVGTQGDIGIYSFGMGKGLTIFKGGCLAARDSDVRAGLRAAGKRLTRRDRGMEVRRVAELLLYHLFYNPTAITFAYGAPRRFWLARGQPERAIGDEHAPTITLDHVGSFRRRVGMQSLQRLASHIEDSRRRRGSLAHALDNAPSRLKPYLGGGEPTGLFLFAMTDTAGELDALLATAWPARIGISKLFMSAIGRYKALSSLLAPSLTPNAEHFAATTLTITTSGFMTAADMSAIISAMAPSKS
jgi:dTDP-4-amino-4,6-dideoxygalactose transaminase